ncbi:predicted protein [Histoplasma capsulatum var. duboisii H88]|uniref:Predicted protein n=2 Tax=Ajellomyces capsulatus TaxID=5037 RepID=F0UA41_AJEC8|nr:predicted protein [Histoplasma capsulatum H143]EGC42813.1 predicted protein [Histoplasma capsulatum var. duboisii H88]
MPMWSQKAAPGEQASASGPYRPRKYWRTMHQLASCIQSKNFRKVMLVDIGARVYRRELIRRAFACLKLDLHQVASEECSFTDTTENTPTGPPNLERSGESRVTPVSPMKSHYKVHVLYMYTTFSTLHLLSAHPVFILSLSLLNSPSVSSQSVPSCMVAYQYLSFVWFFTFISLCVCL